MIHRVRTFYLADFTDQYAANAARLHMAGQPGTFLTSLGADVLAIVYRALPNTAAGFGVVALDQAQRVVGFVSATTSTGLLFANVALEHGTALLPALGKVSLQKPSLIGRMISTAAYPFMVARDEGERTAELLSIMVEPEMRGGGIGAALLGALIVLCQDRHVHRLDVTVDAANAGARRFYAAHGFTLHREYTMYGRTMCQYSGRVEDDLPARLQHAAPLKEPIDA